MNTMEITNCNVCIYITQRVANEAMIINKPQCTFLLCSLNNKCILMQVKHKQSIILVYLFIILVCGILTNKFLV